MKIPELESKTNEEAQKAIRSELIRRYLEKRQEPESEKPSFTLDFLERDGSGQRLCLYEVEGERIVTKTIFANHGKHRIVEHETLNEILSILKTSHSFFNALPPQIQNDTNLVEIAGTIGPGEPIRLNPGEIVWIRPKENVNGYAEFAEGIYLAMPYLEAREEQKQRLNLIDQACNSVPQGLTQK